MYPSAAAGLAAIVESLAELINADPAPELFVGSTGTGVVLPCCDSGSLVIEEVSVYSPDGVVPFRRNCKKLRMIVDITYLQCWKELTRSGKELPVSQVESASLDNVNSGWDALAMIEDSLQGPYIYFVSLDLLAPDGGCIGWKMRVEVELKVCR